VLTCIYIVAMQQAELELERAEHEKFFQSGLCEFYHLSLQRHSTMSDLSLWNFPLFTQHISTSFFHKGQLHSPLHIVGVQVSEHDRYWFRRLEVSPSSILTQLMGTRLHISKQWEFLGVTSASRNLEIPERKRKPSQRWCNLHAKVFWDSWSLSCFWQPSQAFII